MIDMEITVILELLSSTLFTVLAGVFGKGAEMRRCSAVNILFAPISGPMHNENQQEIAVA